MKLHRRLFGLVKARHGAFSLNDTGLTTPEVPLDSKVGAG